MVPNFMPTLLTSSACTVVAMLVLFSGPLATYFSSLCGGFVSSSASFVQTTLIAAPRLFGVSAAFLCLYCAFELPMPAAICRDQLFPLGLLIGVSGGYVLAGLSCVTDAIIHFGVCTTAPCRGMWNLLFTSQPPLWFLSCARFGIHHFHLD